MKKKRPPTKSQLEAEANWKKLNAKWDSLPKFARAPKKAAEPDDQPVQSLEYREGKFHPSKGGMGQATKKPVQKYTGNNVLGVAVMHKSSMVPVFSQEEAIDIAKMRRG